MPLCHDVICASSSFSLQCSAARSAKATRDTSSKQKKSNSILTIQQICEGNMPFSTQKVKHCLGLLHDLSMESQEIRKTSLVQLSAANLNQGVIHLINQIIKKLIRLVRLSRVQNFYTTNGMHHSQCHQHYFFCIRESGHTPDFTSLVKKS